MTGHVPVMTARGIQVITLVANGRTNRQIAERLGIEPDTVNDHLKRVYASLGARDRAHAVGLAIRFGYLAPSRIQSLHGPAAAQEEVTT